MIPEGALDSFAYVITIVAFAYIGLVALGLIEFISGGIWLIKLNRKKEKNTGKKVCSIILLVLGSIKLFIALMWTIICLITGA